MMPEPSPALRALERSAAELHRFDQCPDSAQVRIRTLQALFSVTKPTIYSWCREGILPKPVKLGSRVTVWNVGDLRRALVELGLRPKAGAR